MPDHYAVNEVATPAQMCDAGNVRVSVLVLSQDGGLVNAVRDLGRNLAMTIDACAELLQATRKIATVKYQGIVVDYRNELSAGALINGVRGSTSNSADVVFAFVNDAIQAVAARKLGANFIVPEPFTADSVAPYIRAGYGLMVHELRRYFRAPVVFPVSLVATDGRILAAQSTDLSSGGMAILAPKFLMSGQRFVASFRLPGSNEAVEVCVEVCWSDRTCRTGLRFDSPSQLVQSTIQRWLRVRIDQDLGRPS